MAKISSKDLTVYLDHHIRRDSLLYNHSNDSIAHTPLEAQPPKLLLKDLINRRSTIRNRLRKPDFQRATAAWTPEDCVSLLEVVLAEGIVPSVIMWQSPDKCWYVLDGGHRVSVVLAWLGDDWGDKLSPDVYMDKELEDKYKEAAKRVRKLLKEKGICTFAEYSEASEVYENAQNAYDGEGSDNVFGIDNEIAKRGLLYRAIDSTIGFPLQWVGGDYKNAENSFLNINKSGRKLTDWERRLVENRNSSLARIVMSLNHTPSAQYCWPNKQPQRSTILDYVTQLHKLLFEPPYDSKFQTVEQPLLVESRTEPDKKPAYIAELLTIVKGEKGQEPQTEKLLKSDRSATELELLKNGEKVLRESIDICTHLTGASTQPQSLSLVPALYFYADSGKHMRSLLYGFVYWLFYGKEEAHVFARKLLFSAHRQAFEQILTERRKSVVNALSRKVGSGSEVTGQMAKYYNRLLNLLIKHNSDITSIGFITEYDEYVSRITKEDTSSRSSRGKNRVFTNTQKAAITRLSLLESLPLCPICGGKLNPSQGKQFDHTLEYSKGGATVTENGRLTHPFCNNNRWRIEQIKAGQQSIQLPPFIDTGEIRQLSFLTDLDYDDYDSPLSSMSE